MQPIGERYPVVLGLIAKHLTDANVNATNATHALRERHAVACGRAPFVDGQRFGQIGEAVADALEFLFALGQRTFGHIVGNVIQIAYGHIHAVYELCARLQLCVHLGVQQILVRRRYGQAIVNAHIRIPFGFPFARLPDLFVRACQKMIPDLALRYDRMPADPVDKLLQLYASMLHKLLLIPARDLLVRQRRHRYQTELVRQPLVQPIEVLVATRHLCVFSVIDIARLDRNSISKCVTQSQELSHSRMQR